MKSPGFQSPVTRGGERGGGSHGMNEGGREGVDGKEGAIDRIRKQNKEGMKCKTYLTSMLACFPSTCPFFHPSFLSSSFPIF